MILKQHMLLITPFFQPMEPLNKFLLLPTQGDNLRFILIERLLQPQLFLDQVGFLFIQIRLFPTHISLRLRLSLR